MVVLRVDLSPLEEQSIFLTTELFYSLKQQKEKWL